MSAKQKLTDGQIDEILARHKAATDAEPFVIAAVAKEYKVNASTISRLVNRKAHIEGQAIKAAEPVRNREPHWIPFRQIVLGPNVRAKKAMDPDRMAELAASIRKDGLLQPITVRPLDPDADTHDLVLGQRRYHAILMNIEAGAVGKDGQPFNLDWPVPVTTRSVEDDERILVQLAENLQREDMHPLDEGAAFLELADAYGMSGSEISAAVFGSDKKTRYVQTRSKLARDLCDAGKAAFRAGHLILAQAEAFATGETVAQETWIEAWNVAAAPCAWTEDEIRLYMKTAEPTPLEQALGGDGDQESAGNGDHNGDHEIVGQTKHERLADELEAQGFSAGAASAFAAIIEGAELTEAEIELVAGEYLRIHRVAADYRTEPETTFYDRAGQWLNRRGRMPEAAQRPRDLTDDDIRRGVRLALVKAKKGGVERWNKRQGATLTYDEINDAIRNALTKKGETTGAGGLKVAWSNDGGAVSWPKIWIAVEGGHLDRRLAPTVQGVTVHDLVKEIFEIGYPAPEDDEAAADGDEIEDAATPAPEGWRPNHERQELADAMMAELAERVAGDFPTALRIHLWSSLYRHGDGLLHHLGHGFPKGIAERHAPALVALGREIYPQYSEGYLESGEYAGGACGAHGLQTWTALGDMADEHQRAAFAREVADRLYCAMHSDQELSLVARALCDQYGIEIPREILPADEAAADETPAPADPIDDVAAAAAPEAPASALERITTGDQVDDADPDDPLDIPAWLRKSAETV